MGIILKITSALLGYSDEAGVNANPLLKLFDFTRRYDSIPAVNGESRNMTIQPGATSSLFDGTRSMPSPMVPTTTTLTLAKLSSTTSTYRLSIASGGAFRTERSLSLVAASSIAVSINNSAIATFTLSLGGSFAAAQIGDIIRIKGPKAGDTAPFVFASSNSGYWQVLSSTSTTITAKRLPGESFEGINEAAVVIGASDTANQFRVYSNAGIQKGDSFIIQGSLSSASFNSYDVKEVAPNFIDFVSGISIPEQSGVILASADDIVFYTNAKKLVYVESDQKIVLKFNGSTEEGVLVDPILYNDQTLPGYFMKWGFAWKCEVVNKSSTNSAQIRWIDAE